MGNIPQKIRILKFIAEQGVATIDDIRLYLGSQNHSASIRVTLYQLGIAHFKYGNFSHGVWYLQNTNAIKLLKTYIRDFPTFPIRKVPMHLIPHALGLNHIRSILKHTSYIKVDGWWSENFIRSLPAKMRFGISLSKIPDAIFWRLRSDGSRQKFFLEYERTLKSKSRYLDLFQYYADRKDVLKKNVLYICENELIKSELEKIERFLAQSGRIESVGLYFQFITFKHFCDQHTSVNQNKKEEGQCALLTI